MRRANQVAAELGQIDTIKSLTEVFENIASLRIGKIKTQVLSSNHFFEELWRLYTRLRIEVATPALQALEASRTIERTALVLITSEGGLSGDIDERIIEAMQKDFEPAKVDLVALGYHGVVLLHQRGIQPKKFFRLPQSDAPVNVAPVIESLRAYKQVVIYYQKFVSLTNQRVEKIPLLSAVRSLGKSQTAANKNFITPREFLFEPSIDEVVIYLETVMMEIALVQTVLDSRLSQLASRFNAMRQAQDRAKDMSKELKRKFFDAKRALSDERIREVVAAMEVQ